jgi:hypothetical protein
LTRVYIRKTAAGDDSSGGSWFAVVRNPFAIIPPDGKPVRFPNGARLENSRGDIEIAVGVEIS